MELKILSVFPNSYEVEIENAYSQEEAWNILDTKEQQFGRSVILKKDQFENLKEQLKDEEWRKP